MGADPNDVVIPIARPGDIQTSSLVNLRIPHTHGMTYAHGRNHQRPTGQRSSMQMKHAPHTAHILSHPQTLVDLLSQRGLQQPDRVAFRYLTEGDTTEVSLTYAELDERARAIGAMLQRIGVEGERILLLYPSGL